MDIFEKHFSLIALGNFNPSILTHDFLEKECQINNLGKPSKISPFQIPVISQINYSKVELLLELSRFQIKEDISPKILSLEIFNKYINVLCHTPITKVGINFNLQLEYKSKSKQAFKILKNPKTICAFFKKSKLQVTRESLFDEKKEEQSIGLQYIVPLSGSERYRINLNEIKRQENSFTLNFNFEIDYKKNFNIIIDKFSKIRNNYNSFIELLKG